MNFTLLGRMNAAIEAKIRQAKNSGQEYYFMEIKRHILDVYHNQIGANRDEYSKEISSHFGKIGAKKRKEKKEIRIKLIAVLKEALQIRKIQEAEEIWLQEKLREGSVMISEEGDLTYLEEEED